MSDFCKTEHIKKIRKPHFCEFCGRNIPKGTPNVLHWSGKYEGEFQNSYACHWCEDHERGLVDKWDDVILEFSDCLIEDIFCEELEPFGKVYYENDGDYFVFKSRETDKEVKRIKCPINREAKP